jgi:hypothetical protein
MNTAILKIKSLYYYVFFLFNVSHSFFNTGKSHVRHLCCFLLSTCKGKAWLDIVRPLYLFYFRINGKHLLVQNTTVLTRQF